jgi:hypothetical protein
MNIVFMNLKVIKDIHLDMSDNSDNVYLESFHKILERHCPGEDWENYRDISPEEYYTFYYKAKILIDEKLSPGVLNTDYSKIFSKQAKSA